MKNRALLGVLAVVAIAGFAWWWMHRGGEPATVATTGSGSGSGVVVPLVKPDPKRVDPHALAKATIAGTITDEAKAPVAGILVCADASSDELSDDETAIPYCAPTAADGTYLIADLFPARYKVSAGGKPFRPTAYHVGNDRKKAHFKLAAGEHKTGIDIVMRGGGVEVTGTVIDATGGPIAAAHVQTSMWGRSSDAFATTKTDDKGTFSMWVAPGDVSLTARADGYTDGSDSGHAPGRFEIILTPESTLAGIVVDGTTNQPVPGAHVSVSSDSFGGWESSEANAITDDKGAFRVHGLSPGRKVSIARTSHGYGRTEGSVLVGLAQQVDGVVVKLFPAFRITGKVVDGATKQVCTESNVSFQDKATSRYLDAHTEDDGTVVADGVLPGTYTVDPYCRTFRAQGKYAPITITDRDVVDQTWEMAVGATVTGKVSTASGTIVEDANVWASTIGGAPRARTSYGGDTSTREGTYALEGLTAGKYRIEVSSDRGTSPKDGFTVEVPETGSVTKDLVLEDGGSIAGTIVDGDGKPVAGTEVSVRSLTGGRRGFGFGGGDNKSDDNGNFQIDALAPGDYRVTAGRGWFDNMRKPGTTDDDTQGERATVKVKEVAHVKLVVEGAKGTIGGTVVGSDGKPVGDAYISTTRESDAAGAAASTARASTRWTWDEKPVITSTEGAFTVTKLTPGKYTVRAYRKGGGEAFAEHVAVGTTTVKLQIEVTASIEGVAHRAGAPLTLIEVTASDVVAGFDRTEKFYMTEGRFKLDDLPKGHFRLRVKTAGGQKDMELDLASGEHKTGVTIELEALTTISGRLVENGTQKPIPGMRMSAGLVAGGSSFSFSRDADQPNVTDEQGKFTIENVPRGKLGLRGFPVNFSGDNEFGFVTAYRDTTANTSATIDIGDITAIKRRVKRGDPSGDMGVHFVQQPRDTLPEARKDTVSYIDPKGPAASVDLKVGDTFTSVDGIDCTGTNSSQCDTQMIAPPGTVLTIGLARGTTIKITLAAPK